MTADSRVDAPRLRHTAHSKYLVRTRRRRERSPTRETRAGRTELFHPIVPLRSALYNILPSPSIALSINTVERARSFIRAFVDRITKKTSLYWCRNVFTLSDSRWKLAVSFVEGAMSGLLFLWTAFLVGGKGIEDSREMFLLMCFPLGRKTHVVAFNLIRVTLWTVSRLHALRDIFCDNFY